MKMHMRPAHRIGMFLMCLSFCMGLSASAGTLRDKIIERRQAQQQDDMLEADGASPGSPTLPAGVHMITDFPYGGDAAQRMDIYVPSQAKKAPVLLMVHGGGWRRGDKSMVAVIENKIARWVPKGFIFISINYRMLPGTDPLQQADDVAQALAVAQSHAATWGGDASRFILIGHSAGAHLVSLVSAEPAKAFKLGVRPWLGTISLDSAAFDLIQIMEGKHYRFYDQAFGKSISYWKAASPIHQLTAGARPMLAVCSSKRPDKPCQQAHNFADKAASLDIRVSVLEQALSHREINQNMGLPGAYTDAVEAFMGTLDDSIKRALMSAASR